MPVFPLCQLMFLTTDGRNRNTRFAVIRNSGRASLCPAAKLMNRELPAHSDLFWQRRTGIMRYLCHLQNGVGNDTFSSE